MNQALAIDWGGGQLSAGKLVWVGGNLRQPPIPGLAFWRSSPQSWTVIDAEGNFIARYVLADRTGSELPYPVYWTEKEAREASMAYLKTEIERREQQIRHMKECLRDLGART